jgi:Transglycosylase SLT domain
VANQAIIFGLVGGGALLLTAAITDSGLGQTIQGHANKASDQSSVDTFLNGLSNGKGAVGSAGSSLANAGSGGGGSSSSVTGKVTSSMLASIGQPFGWTASQLEDWMAVIDRESGGNPNAVNKSSGAYGIGQFLASGGSPTNLGPNELKYFDYGGNPNTVSGQLKGMANYILERYGTPAAALAHENEYGWY